MTEDPRAVASPSTDHAMGSRSFYLDLVRLGLVCSIVAISFLLARDQFHTPSAQPLSTARTEFSSARAMEHVEAVAVSPRPQGSAAATAGRDYIAAQLTA